MIDLDRLATSADGAELLEPDEVVAHPRVAMIADDVDEDGEIRVVLMPDGTSRVLVAVAIDGAREVRYFWRNA